MTASEATVGLDFDPYLRLVEEELEQALQPLSPVSDLDGMLFEDVHRLVQAGGKRVRPRLALIGFLAGGGDPADRRVAKLGAAIELCHCAALIHDDIIDGAQVRRGMQTSHTAWAAQHAEAGLHGDSVWHGVSAALLAGLLANAVSEQFLHDMPLELRSYWGAMKRDLVIGEFVELEASAEERNDPALLRHVAQLKTSGYTVSGPLVLGACLAGASHLEPHLERFGAAIGEAFQLRDDLLDLLGSQEDTGKSGDLDQDKATTLLGHLVEIHPELAEMKPGPARREAVRAILDEPRVRQLLEQRIEEMVQRGRAAIEEAGLTEEIRAVMCGVALKLAYRNT